MTGMPEASLARELALCFTTLALVTDLDAGFESGAGVTYAEVMEVFARGTEALKVLIGDVLAALPDDDCTCRHALDGVRLPFELPE
jgi:5'-methylthioadenosine phosphorylase